MKRSTAAALTGLALFFVLVASASASTPTITYSIDGISGTNGWYRGSAHGDNVVVHWSVSLDTTSTNCLAAVPVAGPTKGTTETCWAANASGRTTAVTRPIKIDATPPTRVAARLSRRPDVNGWYNHPVTIHWEGADATSGIASCTSGTYRGPDTGDAAVNGGCIDRAGNSAGYQVHLAYDATPPVLRSVSETSTAASISLRWSSSSAADRIRIRRSVRGRKAKTTIFAGGGAEFTDRKIRPGVQYVYWLRSFDQAGNGSKVVSIGALSKILTLRRTPYVPRAAPNPILRWRRLPGATYYNVQLFHGSRRIYSAWPTMHQIGLHSPLKWSGHRSWLTPGRYRWYVWAGFGARRLAHYEILGSARFELPRANRRSGSGKH
jgi:hypothetical protein